MALDFPASPTPGQQFNAAGSSWVWDGTAWNIVPQMVDAVASDTPPANPAVGQLWWRASTGQLYIYYDDGNSQQWVQAAGAAPASPGGPRIIDMETANNGSWGIDIKPGSYSGGNGVVVNGAVFTKKLDTAWVEGSGNGGRDTATAVVANTTYHLFALRKSDGTFDAVFSPNIVPVVPTGFTLIGRIGSYYTNTANTAIRAFTQVANYFYMARVVWISGNVATADAVYTMPVTVPAPNGIVVEMLAYAVAAGVAGFTASILAGAPESFANSGPIFVAATAGTVGVAANQNASGAGRVPINKVRQMRLAANVAGSSTVSIDFGGWLDTSLPRLGAS